MLASPRKAEHCTCVPTHESKVLRPRTHPMTTAIRATGVQAGDSDSRDLDARMRAECSILVACREFQPRFNFAVQQLASGEQGVASEVNSTKTHRRRTTVCLRTRRAGKAWEWNQMECVPVTRCHAQKKKISAILFQQLVSHTNR